MSLPQAYFIFKIQKHVAARMIHNFVIFVYSGALICRQFYRKKNGRANIERACAKKRARNREFKRKRSKRKVLPTGRKFYRITRKRCNKNGCGTNLRYVHEFGRIVYYHRKVFSHRISVLILFVVAIVADPDPVPFLLLDPGSGMGKKLGSGSWMKPESYFRELRNNFLG